MTFREVKYLGDSYELQKLIAKYHLELKNLNDEKILLISECFVFEIYGLVVEDFFYFDLYSINLEYSSTLNVLLSDFDSEKLRSTYQLQLSTRKHVKIPKLQGDRDNTLKAEVYFFTMLQLMDELLSNILSCEKEIKQEHWSEIFQFKKNQLKEILEGLK